MNTPKFSQVSNPAIKSLININDMIKSGASLKAVKAQATMKGFTDIAKTRTFKAAIAAVKAELEDNGLISI